MHVGSWHIHPLDAGILSSSFRLTSAHRHSVRPSSLPSRISVSVTLRKKRFLEKLLTQILLKFTRLSTCFFSPLISAVCLHTDRRYSSLFGLYCLKLYFYELRHAYLQIPWPPPLTCCWKKRFEHTKRHMYTSHTQFAVISFKVPFFYASAIPHDKGGHLLIQDILLSISRVFTGMWVMHQHFWVCIYLHDRAARSHWDHILLGLRLDVRGKGLVWTRCQCVCNMSQ